MGIQAIAKKTLVGTALLVALAGLFSPVAGAQSAIEENLKKGACLNVDDANCITDEAANQKINAIITQVINIFSLVVGVVSVIMIIIGGFKYITSGGDSGNVTGAKNTILYAVIGLVIVALAQFIVRFVLNRITQAGTVT